MEEGEEREKKMHLCKGGNKEGEVGKCSPLPPPSPRKFLVEQIFF